MNAVNSNPEDEIQKSGPSVGQIIKEAREAAKVDIVGYHRHDKTTLGKLFILEVKPFNWN